LKSTINLYLFLYSLLQLGYIFSFGVYALNGILILLFCLLIWFAFFFKSNLFDKNFDFSPQLNLYFLLNFSVIFSLFLIKPTLQQGGIPFRPPNFADVYLIIMALSAVSLFLGIFLPFFSKRTTVFLLLLSISTILRLLFIYVSPYPRMDTYDIIRLGSLGLIRGENPYQMTFIPISEPNYKGVEPNYFSYTPGILTFSVPAILLFKDQRIFFAIANIITSILLYLIIKRNKKIPNTYSLTLPLIFLFNPSSYFIILRGWTDPAVILFLTLIATSLVFNKFKNSVLILLAIVATTKQTLVFIPLFFLSYLQKGLRALFIVGILSGFIVAPFVIWSPKDFLQDTVLFHFKNPVRHEALMINNLYYFLSGSDIPPIILISIIVITGVFILKKQKRKTEEIYLSMGLWYFTFFLFNTKQAFVNYYYFISSLILLYIALKISNSTLSEE